MVIALKGLIDRTGLGWGREEGEKNTHSQAKSQDRCSQLALESLMAASKHTSAIISAKGNEGGHFKNRLMRKFPETLNNLSFNMLLEEQQATASINFQPLDVLKFEIQAGGGKKKKKHALRVGLTLSSACRSSALSFTVHAEDTQ